VTSRTGRSRAFLAALALAAALAPGVAHAQIPGLPPILQPPDDDEPGAPGPPKPLPSSEPGSDATEDQINAARTNYSNDDSLIPALELRWTRRLDPAQVLIGDRTVFVLSRGNSRASVIAVAGASGRTLWSVPTSPHSNDGVYSISYEAGTLVTSTLNGVVTAHDGSSGRVLETPVPGHGREASDGYASAVTHRRVTAARAGAWMSIDPSMPEDR